MRRALVTAGASLVLALAAVLGLASAASAHDQLLDATPAEGDTVTSADVVTLTYSSALLGATDETANLAQVVGPDGRHYETACASVSDAALTVPVALGAAGEYTVSWRVVSGDGHPVAGDYAFTYAPAEGTDAAAGADASPCAAVAAGGDTEQLADGDGTGAGLAVGLSAGAVVLGILVIIVTVGIQARKKKSDPEE